MIRVDIWGLDTAFTDMVFDVGIRVGSGSWFTGFVARMFLGIWSGMNEGIKLGMSCNDVGSALGTVWNGDPSDTNGSP